MALLNPSPVLALPTTMWVTFEAIAELGPLDEPSLYALTSPISIRATSDTEDPPPTNAAREAFRALRDHGLVKIDDHGSISAAVTVKPRSYPTFCAVLRHHLVTIASNQPPLDESGANDLLRGLVWLLSTDPLGEAWNEPKAAQQRIPNGPTPVFINPTRWNGFRFWAEALGLAEDSAASNEGAALVANPTRAVRDFVAATFDPGEVVPASSFLDQLRVAVPVLPGGTISRASGYDRDQDELDRATSYALESGHLRGWLTLETHADAPDAVLLASLDRPGAIRRVSHVAVHEVADV